MSPELFVPEEFDLKDRRPTKNSDCYALGMVIYEVLSGQKPFARYERYAVVVRIHRGERPVRPRRVKGRWFSYDIWNMLERCWERNPGDRPRVEEVLHYLEASRSWTPPLIVADPTTYPSTRNSDSSSAESTGECQVSSSSMAQSRSLRTPLYEGDADEKRFH